MDSTTFVVFEKHVYVPENTVWFCYDLDEALCLMRDLSEKNAKEYGVAAVIA